MIASPHPFHLRGNINPMVHKLRTCSFLLPLESLARRWGEAGPRSISVLHRINRRHAKVYRPRRRVPTRAAPVAYLDQVGDHHLRGVHALPKQLVVDLDGMSQAGAVQNVRGPVSAFIFMVTSFCHEFRVWSPLLLCVNALHILMRAIKQTTGANRRSIVLRISELVATHKSTGTSVMVGCLACGLLFQTRVGIKTEHHNK